MQETYSIQSTPDSTQHATRSTHTHAHHAACSATIMLRYAGQRRRQANLESLKKNLRQADDGIVYE